MVTMQFSRSRLLASYDDEPVQEIVQVNLPWNKREETVVDELPEENGKAQYSIREYRGLDVQRPRWETEGWTVEWLVLLNPPCEWADFWITAPVVEQRRVRNYHSEENLPTTHPSYLQRIPAINLSLEDALNLAKNLNDGKNKAREERGSTEVAQQMALVRARHQFSGNIVVADIMP